MNHVTRAEIPNQKRLEEIAYGSVRQSQAEGRFMARTLLVVMGQKPVAYTDEAELTFPHATSDMWPAPFNFGKDVALFRHPSSGKLVLHEKAAFEAWLEADYSPDRSGATSDMDEQFFLSLCWHIWLARAALAEPTKEQQHSAAISDVIAERLRQQSVKGFTTQQDDTYIGGELAAAAICYIEPMEAESYWPADWLDDSFKPSCDRRDLVKACALLIAEIERIDRQQPGEIA